QPAREGLRHRWASPLPGVVRALLLDAALRVAAAGFGEKRTVVGLLQRELGAGSVLRVELGKAPARFLHFAVALLPGRQDGRLPALVEVLRDALERAAEEPVRRGGCRRQRQARLLAQGAEALGE